MNKAPTTIDFETFPIEKRPNYPPKPVGVAIKRFNEDAYYLSWGHSSNNNCTFTQAKQELIDVCLDSESLLFHNAKFDIDVLETFFGITLEWNEIEDTLFLSYLNNPHQDSFGLKYSAELLLGMKPEEQDVVVDWLINKQPLNALEWCKRTTGMEGLSDAPKSPAYAGAYVAFAPGDIVGDYAIGDVVRTERLWTYLIDSISSRGMEVAYDRERKLLPILLSMERQGVPVALNRLETDVEFYTNVMCDLQWWITQRLQCDPLTNLDSGAQLVKACE